MKINTLSKFGFLAVTAFFAGSASLMASTISFSGTLPNPNALFEVQFTIGAVSSVSIFTNGTVGTNEIFPVLWLFNSTDTTQLDKNDPPALSNASMTETNLAAGTYDVILSTFDQHYCQANTNCNSVFYNNTGWSYNGSFFGGSQNFSVTIQSASTFTDNTSSCETNSNGCIHASPTQAFATPEPASVGLLLAGGAVLGWFRMRRRNGLADPRRYQALDSSELPR
jgi:hypothetical protein